MGQVRFHVGQVRFHHGEGHYVKAWNEIAFSLPQNAANDPALTCQVSLSIMQSMSPPIYVFYELNGYYQNNRRYVISRSDGQLMNQNNPDTSLCSPQLNYADNSSLPINPCGLTAWSFFNDSYTASVISSGSPQPTVPLPVAISSTGFAPYSDQKYMFADYNASNFNPIINQYRGGDNITGSVKQDDRFIIWIKLAPLPKFRKLWGVINTPLNAGDTVLLTIVNR